ncbi:MAG: glycosyltransferase [Candidatus Thalassarchaeaceae archaeon]|nr:glycosyltransferase [Euryarchaeota archaeon]NDB93418.1 glycosyltransferase [Euryarchaeota archaeon]NDF22130.1 glycosyltransferase [Euryarchaeota archaeon]NDF36561.1 glycosyltransferase [Euryarchaeota archaeon]NDG21425.1 glycosyltransferase [Euryarchaeota archaeon]
MQARLKVGSDSKPRLLVAKGCFDPMGGAERDIIRVIPSLMERFEVSVATLRPSKEVQSLCSDLGLRLLSPAEPWALPTGIINEVLHNKQRGSFQAWASVQGIMEEISSVDGIHLVSGDGSIGILQLVDPGTRVHVHYLEPDRGLHEVVLHLDVQGRPKRPLFVTRLALSFARFSDRRLVRKYINRDNVRVSANSSYSSSMFRSVYGFEAGIIRPTVSSSEFTERQTDEEEGAWKDVEDLPEPPWVVTVGGFNWVKGIWECISMLEGSGVGLVVIGRGSDEDLHSLREHAKASDVDMWVYSDLDLSQLIATMRRSRAVISMAHGEPFGLTAIEALSVGVPALFVDDGGFRDSIIDGICGRLLPRDDYAAWHRAIEVAGDPEVIDKWETTGRNRIRELSLDPKSQSDFIYDALFPDHSPIEIEEE